MNTPPAKTPSTCDAFAVTESNVAAAFTEWERRFREEPERFWSEAHKLLKETPETYGQACAPYFMTIVSEQSRLTQ